MARESIFARKKRERGSNWVNEIKPDELIKMAENILSDISYGNLSSNEDKWYLVSEPVQNALIAFCTNRCNNLGYIVRCMDEYRNTQTAFFNNGDNAMYDVVWENVYNSYVFYATVKQLLEAYKVTKDPTCMINLYSLAANQKYKNLIMPNRFI